MPSTFQVDDNLYRIELDRPDAWPETLPETNNVYLIDGDVPTLVDTGHPSQFDDLAKGIRELDVRLDAVDRIVATSWSIDAIGGAKNFPDVSPFVLSPDMTRPRNYEGFLASRRDELRETVDDLVDVGEIDASKRDDFETFITSYYPTVTSELDFVPLRGGQQLDLGATSYEVVGAPGPDPGHACLYAPDAGRLFSSRIALRGFPVDLDDVQSYFVTLERLIELDADTVLPASGDVRERGGWALERAHRFVNNFMSNAPQALFKNPTVTEFVERDLGYLPDDPADFVLRVRTYGTLLDELVRSEMIDSSGSGLERRYGTDVDDPREKVRKHW